MNSKVIFLDIDGPLLPKRAFLTEHNQRVLHEASAYETNREKLLHQAKYIKFDELAIALINRMCEKGNAKVVVISNWRRTFGIQNTLDKLLSEGLKPEYLHDNPACKMRGLHSEKIHDLYAWLGSNDFHYKDVENVTPIYDSPFVIIDDEGYQFNRGDRYGKCVTPLFDQGFGLREYRIALAMIGGEDPEFDVNILTREEIDKILPFFEGKENAALYWLYDINSLDNTAPPATLISKKVASTLFESQSNSLWGYRIDNEERLYKIRSEQVWDALKNLKTKR